MVIVFPAWFFEWTFCQLWEQPSLAFALRSRRPTLALARTVFLAGLVIVVHYDVFGLGVLQNPERRIHIGSVNVVDPWPFGFLYAEYVMNEDMAQARGLFMLVGENDSTSDCCASNHSSRGAFLVFVLTLGVPLAVHPRADCHGFLRLLRCSCIPGRSEGKEGGVS